MLQILILILVEIHNIHNITALETEEKFKSI